MSNRSKNVLGLLPPPAREDSLKAVSRALLNCRIKGWTNKDLAGLLDCHPDTIAGAIEEKSLLSLDSAMRLEFHFPEECAPIDAIRKGSPAQALSLRDRFERALRELEAVERELDRRGVGE